MKIAEALQMAENWLDIDGIEGVAQGRINDEDCIAVFVSNPKASEKVPSEFQGYRVVVEETGPFNAQNFK